MHCSTMDCLVQGLLTKLHQFLEVTRASAMAEVLSDHHRVEVLPPGELFMSWHSGGKVD